MSSGFGICGHKNSYSSGVKVGNFVEDQMGWDLAKSMKQHPLNGKTESQARYIDPARIPLKDGTSDASMELENQISRQGLSYQMIFAHGPGIEVDPEVNKDSRWNTTNQITFSTNKNTKNSKGREISKKKAREQRSNKSYMTTTRVDSALQRKTS